MHLTDDDLREFCKVWKEEYGEEISLDEARHHASQLLDLCAQLIKPLPSERAERDAKTPKEDSPLA